MKIAVLASGGVDSSVALKLLKEQGHQVTAFYLKIWLEDELSYLGNCPWEEDLSYLQKICEQENIPLQVIPMQKEYWDNVVSYAINEVKAGRTPNGDVMCNYKVKFGKFFDKIEDQFDLIASGHYANKVAENNTHFLTTAKDSFKDQTYFLAHLTQKQLQRIIFPLGEFTKSKVRELAEKFNLPNKSRKDSQGICFLGKIKYNHFIAHHLGENPGDLINYDTGQEMGRHKGFWFYTVGQRKGIELSHGPWYVVKKDPLKNQVFISNEYHQQNKFRDTFNVSLPHWNSVEYDLSNFKDLQVKVRHGEKLYQLKNLKKHSNFLELQINENDQGLAAGQFCVFYEDHKCLGISTII